MPKTSVKNDRENINSKKAKYMRLFAHLKKPHKVSNKKKKYLTYCICLYIENENDL